MNPIVAFLLLFICAIIDIRCVIGYVCSYSDNGEPICCEGWIRNVYGDCVKSECTQDCGQGRCVGLNVCECFNGLIKSDRCDSPDEIKCRNDCSSRGRCVDGTCQCDSGYVGPDCSQAVVSNCYVTVDRGLCISAPGGLQLSKDECCQIFQVAWGNPCEFCHASTSCGKGYSMKNGRCVDIDECQLPNICRYGQCINEQGSFRCICEEGQQLNKGTLTCEFVKETPDACKLNGFKCGSSGTCVSVSQVEYRCDCRSPDVAGPDGKSCVKSLSYNVCKIYQGLCMPQGVCETDGLSYVCRCHAGFYQSDDKKSCFAESKEKPLRQTDICKNPNVAQNCNGGKCVSDATGYRCICYGNYKPTADFQRCVESNDEQSISAAKGYCSTYGSRCNGGQCIPDSSYGFRCICLPGFKISSDSRSCEEEAVTDVCTLNGRKCLQGKCIEISKTDYVCDCPYFLKRSDDGRSCILAWQVTTRAFSMCDVEQYRSRCAGGDCIPDNYFGFKCVCRLGFRASDDGRECSRIEIVDPCSTNSYKCEPGKCIPGADGDYSCECPSQSRPSNDRKSCLIISTPGPVLTDLCSIYGSRCAGGQCVTDNLYGFRCICQTGYYITDDGRTCLKMEKKESLCSLNKNACNEGRCVEVGNSYECECANGYQQSSDRKACEKVIQVTSICEDQPDVCGNGVCYPHGQTDYICMCDEGYHTSRDKRTCIKNAVTVCAKYQSYCNGGRCIEMDGNSYRCECLSGYRLSLSGKFCERVMRTLRMCDMYSRRCDNGICFPNGDNDFYCVCGTGFYRAPDKRSCLKMFTCAAYGYKCQGNPCVDTEDSYRCICSSEFEKDEDGKRCKPKATDNCETQSHKCRGGFCFNITEGYLCICNEYHKTSEDGRECLPRERISLRSGVEDRSMDAEPEYQQRDCPKPSQKKACFPGKCKVTQTGFACICPPGFVLSLSRHYCVRDSKMCPFCFYGCLENSTKCSCPQKYEDLLNTSLCVKQDTRVTYSIGVSQCRRDRSDIPSNKTVVIKFNGTLKSKTNDSKIVTDSVARLLLPKENRSERLSFCVEIANRRQRHGKSSRMGDKRRLSKDLFSWQVACIFKC